MNFVDTSTLRVGFEDHNPRGSRTAVLVHGWPDSTRTWAGVVPALAKAGWRVLVPALRGFSPTAFRDPAAPRVGQLTSLGRDLLEFVAALGIDKPALVGHDWGARAAELLRFLGE